MLQSLSLVEAKSKHSDCRLVRADPDEHNSVSIVKSEILEDQNFEEV